MTVQDLIDQLQKHPPEMRVIIDGYEGGYHDVDGLEETPIRLNVHDEWSCGPHDDADYTLGDQSGQKETALLIARP
jgi:molybdopterin biosynthesis enzyme